MAHGWAVPLRIRMAGIAESHRNRVCEERDDALGFGRRKVEAKALVKRQVKCAAITRLGLQEGDPPSAKHNLVSAVRAWESHRKIWQLAFFGHIPGFDIGQPPPP